MRFYTNVQLVGNQFLVRGYDNGEHFSIREEYMPTLFVDSQKKSKYKTLEGTYVEPVQPGFVRDCRDFFNKYDGVEGFNIYGNERYIYQYISDKYPDDEIQFDISKIKLSKPTLFISGIEDYLFVRQIEEYVKDKSNCFLEKINNSGHIVNIDQYQTFNKVALKFLK